MHTTITRKIRSTESKCTIKSYKLLKMFVTDISVLVVAKIGCENVQLKIKTVKSIRNRYLYF